MNEHRGEEEEKGFRPGNEPRTRGCHTVLTGVRVWSCMCVQLEHLCSDV